ncbi:hypothetical protein KJ654_02415 [Patescibacteria group bacterium]|nr:hypothetical protein [Patescibacteria group bacterium]MBU1966815.1 hypothetical protein [Patescibacteria group bacterium]
MDNPQASIQNTSPSPKVEPTAPESSVQPPVTTKINSTMFFLLLLITLAVLVWLAIFITKIFN